MQYAPMTFVFCEDKKNEKYTVKDNSAVRHAHIASLLLVSGSGVWSPLFPPGTTRELASGLCSMSLD